MQMGAIAGDASLANDTAVLRIYRTFLAVIDLDRQLAERRGDTLAAYSDESLMRACGAVVAAAEAGQPSEEQIAAGFGVLRAETEAEVKH